MEADLLCLGFGMPDRDVAAGRGEGRLLVRLGISRPANVDLELLLLLLGLELGDLRLLLND